MADTNDLLKAIESLRSDMATKSDLVTVNKRLDGLGQGQEEIKTALEAVAAGQKDQATKEDIHRLEQKIDKVGKNVKSHTSRIENLEEHTDTPNPHKN